MKNIEHLICTIVFDNRAFQPGLETSWGFACMIEGAQKTILFDTGGDSAILLKNMEMLSIDPATIDLVVISHKDDDHAGGLSGFIAQRGALPIYLPFSFPKKQKQDLEQSGCQVTSVQQPMEIIEGVWSLGEMKGIRNEHSLVVETTSGPVLITGCAHPGIVSIAQAANDQFSKDLALVLGGFHLRHKDEREIRQTITTLKTLGIRKIAPSHCTGDEATSIFAEIFGEACLPSGVGAVFRV